MFEDAKPRRATHRINTRTDLVAVHTHLNEELAELLVNQEPARPRRKSDQADPATGALTAKAAEIEAVEQEMAASWITLVLQPQSVRKFREFKLKHPPELAEDEPAGCDMDAFLREFVPECVVDAVNADGEHVEFTSGDWKRAFDDDAPGIWPGDQVILARICFGFYIATFNVPKSRLLSALTQTVGEQQEQLTGSVSPTAGSPDGNQSSGTSSTRRKAG